MSASPSPTWICRPRSGRPDLDALARSASMLVIGIGEESAGQLCDRTSRALGEALGTAPTAFPGDHVGFVDDPTRFAERLRDVLAASVRGSAPRPLPRHTRTSSRLDTIEVESATSSWPARGTRFAVVAQGSRSATNRRASCERGRTKPSGPREPGWGGRGVSGWVGPGGQGSGAGEAAGGQRDEDGHDHRRDQISARTANQPALWPRAASASSPSASARTDPTIGVTGWCSAIGCIQPGIDSTGT